MSAERERTDSRSAGTPAAVESGNGVLITSLAELPERTLLDESALANALRVTKRTVRRMVSRFELPPPIPFAGRSTWQAGRVLAWFEARAERVARDARRISDRLPTA